MNATQHLAQAEQLLGQIEAGDTSVDPADVLNLALDGIGHALIAIAIAQGIPHGHPALSGGDNAAG